MSRRLVLAVFAVSTVSTGCGGSAQHSPSSAAAQPPTTTATTAPLAATSTTPSLAQSRAAALNELTQPATLWSALPSAYQIELTVAYLDGPGRRYKASVSPDALLVELSSDTKQGIDDTTASIGNMLRFAADLASAGANGNARAKYLNATLVGKSAGTVRRLIGDPDHEQSIGGQQDWYYALQDNTYQVVFGPSMTVTQVNKY